MRILLILNSLPGGGSGRVMTQMANYWSGECHHVSILTFESSNTPFYPLSNSVKWHAIDIKSQSSSWIRGLLENMIRIFRIRKAVLTVKPDYIISFVFTTNILILLATRFLNCPLIISERNHPDYGRKTRLIWYWLRRILYPLADHLVVQTREIKEWFRLYNNSIHIIANPAKVIQESTESGPEISLPPGKRIIAMGQLSSQKGFDLLLDIFANIHRTYQEWNLIILGTGPLREDLISQAGQLGIERFIHLPGMVANPFSVLKKCDLFVLSSRYEGFPNVLLEAMASGLPVISFECPSGPGEIIQNGVNGILVPAEDTVALERALYELIENKELRDRLGNEAQKICERYATTKIMKQWERLLYCNKR